MFGSGFGQQANNNTSSFGFGQNSQPTSNTGSIFGQPAQSSPFGQPVVQNHSQSVSSPFGSLNSNQFGSGVSGGGLGSSLGSNGISGAGLTGNSLGGSMGSSGTGNSLSQLSGQNNRGTAHTPFSVTEEKDSKSATAKHEKFQSIMAMPQYQNTSLQELRFQDYQDNRKGPTSAPNASGFAFGQPQASASGVFGQSQQQPSPFGASNPSPFGSTSNSFGQSNTVTNGFGSGGTTNNAGSSGIFGQSSGATNTAFGNPSNAFGASPSPSATGFGFGTGGSVNNTGTSTLGGFGSTGAASPFGKPAAPSTSTFGQTNTNTGFSSGGFGSTNNTMNSPFGQSNSSGNGLFGQSNNSNNSTSGVFGQNKPSLFGSSSTSTGSFGNNQQGTSLFGSNTTNNTNNTGFGGFGQNNTSNNNNDTNAVSLFGSNNANNNNAGFGQPQSQSLFGQQQQQQQSPFGFNNAQNKPSDTSIFGQASSSPFGQSSNTGGGLFSTNNKPNGTGLFNGTNSNATTGFGNNSNNNNANSGSSLFGSKPALGGFGQMNTTNTTGTTGAAPTGFFGSSTSKPAGTLFGNTGTSLFGQNNSQPTNNNGLSNTGNSLFNNTNKNNQGTAATVNTGGFGSLFGNSNSTTNNSNGSTNSLFGKPAGSGLFGQTANTNTSGGLFGSNNNTNNGNTGAPSNGSGASLFGGQANQGSSLFGNKPTGSNLFGSNSGAFSGGSGLNGNPALPVPQAAGSASLFGNTSQQTIGPVASIDSDAYLSNPLFTNIRQPSSNVSSDQASAVPKKESASFKAPTGMLMAQVMLPRTLPKGQKLKENHSSRHIEASEGTITSSNSQCVTSLTKPSQLSKFKNILFSNNTDDIILNTEAFDFSGNNRKQITSTPSSGTTNSKSSDSKILTAGNTPFATSVSTPSKGRSIQDDEEFSIITPTGAGIGSRNNEDFDFVESRCSDADENDDLSKEVSEGENDLNSKSDLPDNEVVDSNGYWISPCNRKITNMTIRELRNIRNFRVGQRTQGFVEFLEPIDLSGFSNMHQQVCGRLIVFSDRSFCLYPVESERPPVGKGFNVKHQVTLYNIFAHNRETQEPVKDPEHPIAKKFLRKLKAQNNFVSWSAQTGTWTFEVDPAKL